MDIGFFNRYTISRNGLGNKIIELSLDQIAGPLTAYLKVEIFPSYKVFERLGFLKMGQESNLVKYIYS